MNITANTACEPARRALRGALSPIKWRISDLWSAPLTDLPVRDELIRQYIPLSPRMEVMEVGPGNGFPAFRLNRSVATLTLLEVAEGNAANLRQQFARTSNVRVVHDDLCRKELGHERAGNFDAIFAIEVLEFVPDPATGLRNMAAMLRPGGSVFIQFPNYEDPAWPTCYRRRKELDKHLGEAGFIEWEIYVLRLSPWSQLLFHWLHEAPLRLYRARQRTQSQRPQSPRAYDETWAYHHGSRFEALKIPIHLYWAAVMTLMRLGGEVFRRDECGNEILGKNLFVTARKGENGGVTE